MSNIQKKKEVSAHNETKEVMENILQIGECLCKGTLFIYTKSQPENYFKYYCTDCSSEGDIRSPKDKDIIWNGPSKILDYLAVNCYGEDEIEKHIADHDCSNNVERVKLEETYLFEESRYDE